VALKKQNITKKKRIESPKPPLYLMQLIANREKKENKKGEISCLLALLNSVTVFKLSM